MLLGATACGEMAAPILPFLAGQPFRTAPRHSRPRAKFRRIALSSASGGKAIFSERVFFIRVEQRVAPVSRGGAGARRNSLKLNSTCCQDTRHATKGNELGGLVLNIEKH